MTKDEALRRIKEQLGEVLAVQPAEIADDALLVEDLGVSSMEIVQIYVYFQELGVPMADSFNLHESMSVSTLADRVVEAAAEQDADR